MSVPMMIIWAFPMIVPIQAPKNQPNIIDCSERVNTDITLPIILGSDCVWSRVIVDDAQTGIAAPTKARDARVSGKFVDSANVISATTNRTVLIKIGGALRSHGFLDAIHSADAPCPTAHAASKIPNPVSPTSNRSRA